MTEYERAIELANRVLDKPYIDPDGDICVLARQFLRAVELADKYKWQVRDTCQRAESAENCFQISAGVCRDQDADR